MFNSLKIGDNGHLLHDKGCLIQIVELQMSLFPFDIAKIRQLSEQNKLFADFRRNYMRHGSQFVTSPPQAPISCRVEPAGFGSGPAHPAAQGTLIYHLVLSQWI